MLSFVLRPRFQDGGSYVCQATDAGGETVKHIINLEVPGNKLKFTLGAIMFSGLFLSQQLWLMKIEKSSVSRRISYARQEVYVYVCKQNIF